MLRVVVLVESFAVEEGRVLFFPHYASLLQPKQLQHLLGRMEETRYLLIVFPIEVSAIVEQ